MRRLLSILIPLLTIAASHCLAADGPANNDWLAKIRPTHPRMFFNADTWPAVREYTLKHEAAYYARIKRKVAAMPEVVDTVACEKGSQIKYGPNALMAAFVWRMENDRSALEKSRRHLKAGVAFYVKQSAAGQPVNWYSADRVQALAAYDWIHDQLSDDERREIGDGFLKHQHDDDTVKRVGNHNRGNHKSGFYGPPNLPWFVGLALYKDGIDDAAAEALLKRGYADHIDLLEYRGQSAGDDGGIGSLAVGYGLGFYPWSEFNFMHTFQSATGVNLADRYDHMSLLPNWVYWNRLPGNMTWGLADSVPAGKFGSAFLEMHMLQVAHFFAERHPERARFAMWIRENLLEEPKHDDYWWPLAPLMLTGCGTLPEPKGPADNWPLARNFEKMGLVTMRSDWSEDAVCAAFVAGGNINQHRHYDQGHFIIYRKGHLAIDSGDYGPRTRNDHLMEYLYRTVAHNAVLIHAPAEADKPAAVWGGPARTLDGGQSDFGGRQIAFETNADFTYVATDATACYDPRKCKQATRQFVFVHPDLFVICDRVISTKAEYRKSWLLHTVNEPTISPRTRTVRAEYGDSAIVSRTVLPATAVISKVGGPGKEFFSAGKNHPQEGRFAAIRELGGSWRVEISPQEPAAEAVFVHVIRVGDKSLKEVDAELVGEGPARGVRVAGERGPVTVFFNLEGAVGGRITLPETPERALAVTVQPQSGLAAGDEKP